MTIEVDTAILVRLVNLDDVQHDVAAEAVKLLFDRGENLVTAPQNLIEFWAVATRPASSRGGLGMSQQTAMLEVVRFMSSFRMLPESPAVFAEWLRLAADVGVAGRQVHDARLAAWMKVHQVTHILTFNVEDFRRYPHVTPVHPQDISSKVS